MNLLLKQCYQWKRLNGSAGFQSAALRVHRAPLLLPASCLNLTYHLPVYSPIQGVSQHVLMSFYCQAFIYSPSAYISAKNNLRHSFRLPVQSNKSVYLQQIQFMDVNKNKEESCAAINSKKTINNNSLRTILFSFLPFISLEPENVIHWNWPNFPIYCTNVEVSVWWHFIILTL